MSLKDEIAASLQGETAKEFIQGNLHKIHQEIAQAEPTLAGQWSVFNRLVIPANAADTQRLEMQKAFYAGAESLLRLLTQAIDKVDTSGNEDSFVQFMETTRQEMQAFGKSMIERKIVDANNSK